MNYVLISALFLTAHAGKLPEWVTAGSTKDSKGGSLIICSQEALDPEQARQLAENRCLVSAAKLNGVVIKIQDRVVTSLSGSDSNESAEMKPVVANVKCDWTRRFLEPLEAGYRVWLECRVARSEDVSSTTVDNPSPPRSSLPYARGILTLSTLPQPDVIIISGVNGERAVDVTSNAQVIEVREGEREVILRKLKYKELRAPIPTFRHGDVLPMSLTLQREH